MSNRYEIIRATAAGYFTEDIVEHFIKTVSEWESRLLASFFQLKQQGEIAVLEFAGHAGPLLLDITVQKDKTDITLQALSKTSRIHLIETQATTELNIQTEGLSGLVYTAVLEKSRAELREYARHLQRVFAAGER